ncbi:MAG: 3-methyl-2-oxobutanoate hydroxymethyltransferase [Paeniglutamicibacter terrestris]|uniref:3-methyl-2-oxobutanoate hydroxymethyltransferase n=1 Tax=Paeniglutamicibacter terrestris TaxID=2723403 RepID=A0ABX1G8X4_9MICC|nr:3-methyl-2-oxobutanoate hydroxymethyltransferase [Paeniglutamicibacter terrestris]ASN38938.1 3-methyl-2-oxobutanoate hydroxymethyltransferase [Arthrobacter sp. 7749]NKG22474.1 3-methyl-2-oxobutanoate hydroxymethyltransferase [Paeniglutamicibacter terrestris]
MSAHPSTPTNPASAEGAARPRIRLHHLQAAKDQGRKFAMLTAYDTMMAGIFDASGIEVLLVGDSAANTVMGYSSTLPITMDDMIVFAKSVVSGASHALVVCDMPFGSYEVSPEQAVASAVRLMKEGGVHAVKLEGGAFFAPHVRALVAAGVPVMAHIGFTPQSEHALGGYRVQGRGEAGDLMIADAQALEAAGAFAVLMEMVPTSTARRVDEALHVPTVGIGAGGATTGQVLVWQDMLGLGSGKSARFVKKYADLRSVVAGAATAYREDVLGGTFPAAEHEFPES